MRASIIFILLCCFACGNDSYTPKPRMYPRVMYPERAFQTFQNDDCPFSFEFPIYAETKKDSFFFGEKPINDCWFDIHFEDFNCRFYMSYYDINTSEEFDKLRADVFKMAGKVNQRSNYMEEIRFKNKQNVSGLVFEYEGPAASQMQFFLTDTSQHFFRGAMYFQSRVAVDSLAPLSAFIKEDLSHLLETFEWK